MEKIYLAVTYGKQAEAGKKEKVLEDYLKKDGKSNTSSVVNAHTPGAKKARLPMRFSVRLWMQFPERKNGCFEFNLDTGRHHQIRVQMAHAGMPLAGDWKYGAGTNVTSGQAAWLCAPQALPFSIR